MAKTQKPKYSVLRDFIYTEVDNSNQQTKTIDVSAGEQYQEGEYFEKGKYLPADVIPQFVNDEILTTVTE
ncbi:MAG: hypothetical protein LCH54_15530 [Bacteroidetes bacterium]|nr:hypothetical protein [Bacteroidota bacterium]